MIEYLEHHIVDHCNLNCQGCSHFSNLSPEWYETIDEFKTNFQQLQKITNGNVQIIRLMGGEPLLHPNVTDFLIECRKLFPFSRIELVTNGMKLPKMDQKFTDICNKYQIYICISDYGLFNVQDRLKDFKYIRFYSKKTEMYNICLDLNGQQDKDIAYANCDMHQYKWYYFQNDKFYPCCVMGNIHFFNQHFNASVYTSKEDMGISIFENNEDEIKQFLNTPREICKFCDTRCRKNTYHKFKVSKGDIHEWLSPTYQ